MKNNPRLLFHNIHPYFIMHSNFFQRGCLNLKADLFGNNLFLKRPLPRVEQKKKENDPSKKKLTDMLHA